MPDFVLALDQGTSSSRAILFDQGGNIISSSQQEYAIQYPELGWVDFDPTNDLIPVGEHITLAWGRDYGDVSPINGFMVGGDSHEVKVMVDVIPSQAA